MRIGIGYDIHPLIKGRHLILGGVLVNYNKGLLGYSDGDVLTHAIMDALLGAASLRDIGNQFPQDNPQYKDISSLTLLGSVNKMLKEMNYSIANIDSVVIAEAPKIAPYISEMCKYISETLSITTNQVMIKATTNEKLGHLGKGKGIAAYAVALLESITIK
jgi:2-C-methyl-D-erythritol 2,4-cyclodiphosphate synthase